MRLHDAKSESLALITGTFARIDGPHFNAMDAATPPGNDLMANSRDRPSRALLEDRNYVVMQRAATHYAGFRRMNQANRCMQKGRRYERP